MFLKGYERGSMLSSKGGIDGVGYISLFSPKNMDICCSKIRIPMINCNHIDVTTGIYRKLFSDGVC